MKTKDDSVSAPVAHREKNIFSSGEREPSNYNAATDDSMRKKLKNERKSTTVLQISS